MKDYITDRLHGRRVLVVEDDYMLAEDLSDLLRSHGAQVLGPVASVADATKWLASAVHEDIPSAWPDLAILDVRLGAEMVFPFADALSLLGVPFLFASASPSWSLPEVYEAVPHCQKPWENRVMLRTLAGLAQAA